MITEFIFLVNYKIKMMKQQNKVSNIIAQPKKHFCEKKKEENLLDFIEKMTKSEKMKNNEKKKRKMTHLTA